jgi:hypothetical protein
MGYIGQEVARANRPRMRTDREPHIGEYAAKTNAIRDGSQARAAPRIHPVTARCGLLVVVLEHLIAGLGYLRAVLLQASQDGEVALINHGAAVALDIARTGRLFLRGAAALRRLLLGYRTAGNANRQQGECEEKLMHFVPFYNRGESSPG